MDIIPTQSPTPANEYLILVEPIAISLAPNFMYFFKAKEVLQGERFRLKLRITNKGVLHFEGGTIINGRINYNQDSVYPIGDNMGTKYIDALPPNDVKEIDCGIWQASYSGLIRVECTIVEKNSGNLRCYQKLPGSGDLELLENGYWVDFIPVSNETEIQQRYTNKILIFLTLVTVIYYILSIFIKFPIFGSTK